jgi:hypothetical protein
MLHPMEGGCSVEGKTIKTMRCKLEPTYPVIRPDRTGDYDWYLAEDCIATLTDGRQMFIPKGYCFDGHSVPRIAWTFFPPFGRDIYASLVHDVFTDFLGILGVTRQYADKQYAAFMQLPEYKLGKVRSWCMSTIVHIYGYTIFPIVRFIRLIYKYVRRNHRKSKGCGI